MAQHYQNLVNRVPKTNLFSSVLGLAGQEIRSPASLLDNSGMANKRLSTLAILHPMFYFFESVGILLKMNVWDFLPR